MNTLRIGILILFCGIVALLGRQYIRSTSVSSCSRCNVIVILIDTLRADALPCYGYRKQTAPEMCRFAKNSILFTHAYANSSWTLPSTMSLFTSMYPLSHGLDVTMEDTLSGDVRTLPQIFRENGYETLFLSDPQLNIVDQQGFGRGFTKVRYIETQPEPDYDQRGWIDTIDAIRDRNRKNVPVFAFLHTDSVHDYWEILENPPASFPLDRAFDTTEIRKPKTFTQSTWDATLEQLSLKIQDLGNPPEVTSRYTSWHDSFKRARNIADAERLFLQLPEPIRNRITISAFTKTLAETQPETLKALARLLYDESVRRTDAWIGKVLAQIEHDGLSENTVVIITSDHGELLGEKGLVGHANALYRPEIQIPLIIHVPDHAPAARNHLVQLMDIYPTLLDLTGIVHSKTIAGESFIRSLHRDPPPDSKRFIISEWLNDRSIITDTWHLVESVTEDGKFRALYDLRTDPTEASSVASMRNDIVRSLSETLHGTLERQPVYPPQPGSIFHSLDPEFKKQLLDKGYLL